MTTIIERVAKGAALLDTKVPGWVNRVDLPTFSFTSGMNCVLGQVYGDFHTGVEALELEDESPTGTKIQEHGFDWYPGVFIEASELGTEWVRLITGRQGARVPAASATV